MNKLLSTFFTLCTVSTLFAANTPDGVKSDMRYFKDSKCTQLKIDVRNTDKFQSDAMKDLAAKMLAKEYKPDYLSAEYEAYPSPQVLGKTLRLGDGFSKYENMTGVYLEKGEHVIIVGKTNKRDIKLLLPNFLRKPAEGIEPTKDPNGWGLHKKEIPLKEGINIITVDIPTNAYISYFADDYEKAPKIPVHFVTGKANGYFDTGRGDTKEDWVKLLENAVSPMMDARGKYIQVAYPVADFKKITGDRGKELMDTYDKLVEAEYKIMGLVKYKKIPKNRIFSRVNYNYYMFRDGDGVAYLGNEGTMRMVADPDNIVKSCWGFAHEVGHVLQLRPMTWGGMTEVSNNIFSLYVSDMFNGDHALKKEGFIPKAREAIIDKKISFLDCKDVFQRLVPFWQLHMYFTQNGFPDFYPDVMEKLRNNKSDYKGNDTIKYQFEFIKACCEVTKTDLTDFFDQWGFFWVGDMKIGDYANYDFTVTPEMVKETKDWIKKKGYKKPKDDITQVLK